MRLEQYLKRRDEFARRDRLFSWTYNALFFGVLIGNIFLVALVPDKWTIWYLVAFFAFLFGNIWFSVWIGKRRVAGAGLGCRTCSQPLLGVPGDLAETTGKCAHCGGAAFD